ncbi:flagellar filament capping protein FliD [Brenneria izbisi]|uniref:Flagellar hook-associated protein 2 n=1 Tax=Brenneria izbisi TaxID=2939450 RepID=A0AA41XZU2_9GAMM|nr:flagellar filament capping protein FliD [Brenneria izbisi]MCV9880365.1 flagellar filament capping protein FliD [Brenneria izbisi]MCV9883807.1 flagellar filament capping protein FliD [Brenneria izbisi]
MANISSLGVGSGLDLSTLITNIQTVEEQTRLTPIANQQTSYKSQLSGVSALKSALDKLNTANNALAKSESFGITSGSIDAINNTAVKSTNTALSATTDSKAVAGNYSVGVSQLAQAHSILSATHNSATNALGSADGKLTITQANGEKLEIALTGGETSLNDVRDAINKSEGGVSASVIKANDNNYYLMLTAKDTGTESAITVEDSSGTLGNFTQQVAAQNALISINGIEIERQSNTIDDALEGVTLTLKTTTTEGKPETLDISQDITGMKDAITAWVNAYNSVLDVISAQTKYTAVEAGEEQSSSNGSLIGDSTVRGIQSQLRSYLTSVQSESGDFSIMADLGITQNYQTGKLEINNTNLEKALKEEPGNVKAFFVGDSEETGLATQVRSYLQNVLDTTDGVLKTKEDGINATLKKLNTQYTQAEAAIEAMIARYQTQFTKLDSLLSQNNNTLSYLTQQFSSTSSS